MNVDILFVTDPRFQGGTSTGTVMEIEACRRASFVSGLLMIKGPVLRRTRPVHPDLARLVQDGAVQLADPAERIHARLVIVEHPVLFTHLPTHRLRISADDLVLVLNHPETDAAGGVQYDLPRIVDNMATVFGRTVHLAPVGPTARDGLLRPLPTGADLLPFDWLHLIDPEEWPIPPARSRGERPFVIGRHSRPDLLKWPDRAEDAFSVYPGEGPYRVRMLGADRAGLESRYGPLPATWETIAFGQEDVRAFLAGLDAYVYFHADSWREAFGRAPLEAMASGLPVVLPPHFQALFGEAALYAEPVAVRLLLERLREDAAFRTRQGETARRVVQERFGPEVYAERIRQLVPDIGQRQPATRAVRATPEAPVRILMVSSNGVGVGHLTRLLAIARRLPPPLQPVFFTLSQAVGIVREAGYLAEFTPFHKALGADIGRWNDHLAEALHEAIAFYRPRVLVFDGNVPYSGLTRACQMAPDVLTVWVRRAMWSDGNARALGRAESFDAVIEPGEVAGAHDRGPTRSRAGDAFQVPPIILCDPQDRQGRAEAREGLGLPPEAVAVGLQLGAGTNFDLRPIRGAVIEALLAREDVHVVEFVSPITGEAPIPSNGRHMVRTLYPTYPFSAAFDGFVSAAGYNSFHESVMGEIPTVYVPNEAGEMDLQITRAAFAERAGMGLMLRARDVYSAAAAISELLDPDARAAMSSACQRFKAPNGADEAACFISHLARFARADRDTMDGLLRPPMRPAHATRRDSETKDP